MTDTIHALSSGHPPAAIAIVRVGGPEAFAIVGRLAESLPPPRRAGLRVIRDRTGALLDRALVLAFPGPASATGEDLAELHCHGGRAVVAGIEAALAAAGSRRAEPGEFTRRALSHGRIDLAEAESLADLLEAETTRQRDAALAGVEGQVGALIGGWMTAAAGLSARVEVMLDFADEDDVADDGDGLATIVLAARRLADEIAIVLDAPSVERIRDGVRVVIAGPPNAGKSTLLNLLAAREAAIVSPIAGTTRDRVEAPVARAGTAFLLIDTAGLTDTSDPVETIGVARAREAARGADLVLWLGDDPPPDRAALWVRSRADLPGRADLLPGQHAKVSHDDPAGVRLLWDVIAHRVDQAAGSGRPALRERQRRACGRALDDLRSIAGVDPVLIAEHVRSAHAALASALGIDATDAMLDALFSRFCIGK